jgi:hypothetical protein
MDPLDVIRALYDVLSDPTSRMQLLRSAVIGVAVVLPVLSISTGLRRYAKRHGREIPKRRIVENFVTPFVDPRLNEPYELIRRFWSAVFCLIIAIGIVAAAIFSSMPLFYAFVVLASFSSGAKRLYLEACLAFGAVPSPAPEVSLNRVVDA